MLKGKRRRATVYERSGDEVAILKNNEAEKKDIIYPKKMEILSLCYVENLRTHLNISILLMLHIYHLKRPRDATVWCKNVCLRLGHANSIVLDNKGLCLDTNLSEI